MKRQLTASAVTNGKRSEHSAMRRLSKRAPTAPHNTKTPPASGKPTLALASMRRWNHTLVLTGGLNQRSAHTLEAAIERLCEVGVTGITLDLRELDYIDSIGVAAIAFRSGLCERRGYDFTLIPGPRFIQRAFEQAGVAGLLPFREPEDATRAPAEPFILDQRSRESVEQ
jgi:anti-anti-sigma factor